MNTQRPQKKFLNIYHKYAWGHTEADAVNGNLFCMYLHLGGSFQAYKHLLIKCNFIVSWKCKSIYDYYFFLLSLRYNNHLFSSTQLNIYKLFHAMQTTFIHSEDMWPVWTLWLLIIAAPRRMLEKKKLVVRINNVNIFSPPELLLGR